MTNKHSNFTATPLKSATACLLAAVSIAFTSMSQASMNDWQCLTSDFRGSQKMRQEFILASAEASRVFKIAPSVLVGIKRTESGLGLNPGVSNANNNGTTDRGFYQVNTEVWLPEIRRVGAQMDASGLHSVRENALVAAWVLRRQMDRSDVSGTLDAVGHYHRGGGKGPGSNRIRQVYKDKFIKHLKVLVARCG